MGKDKSWLLQQGGLRAQKSVLWHQGEPEWLEPNWKSRAKEQDLFGPLERCGTIMVPKAEGWKVYE